MLAATIDFVRRHSFTVASIAIFALFLNTLKTYNNIYADFAADIKSNKAIVLKRGLDTTVLANILVQNGYSDNIDDAQFATQQINNVLDSIGEMPTLYTLNKRLFSVPSSVVDSCGSYTYRQKIDDSRQNMGLANVPANVHNRGCDTVLSTTGECSIRVHIIKDNNHKIAPNHPTIVRLNEHFLNEQGIATDSVVCYLSTRGGDEVCFKGLKTSGCYSVLPIKYGCEYGPRQGTINGNLGDLSPQKWFGKGYKPFKCSFVEKEHRMPLFDNYTFKLMKADHTVVVRSLHDFEQQMAICFAIFFAMWWLFYILRRKKSDLNKGIIPIIEFLTGFCLLTMFSINDPLTDRILGIETLQGIAIGILIIFGLQYVDIVHFYQDKTHLRFDLVLNLTQWLCKPFRTKVKPLTSIVRDKKKNFFAKLSAAAGCLLCLPLLPLDLLQIPRKSKHINALCSNLPKGTGYILLALTMTLLLFTPLGSEVGGMTVNLNLGFIKFQPCEIVKLLTIFFLAAFFTSNVDKIIKYSAKGNVNLLGSKLKSLIACVVGLGGLIFLYLLLGDMGPGLVLAFTFIILYSTVKSKVEIEKNNWGKNLKRVFTCDLAMLIFGITTFVMCLLLGRYLDNMGLMCVCWFFIWIVAGVIKGRIFESAILFNLVITAFIFGANIASEVPFMHSVGERLELRNEMCTNTWGDMGLDANDNRLHTDEPCVNTQVAEGLWGLASGGLVGQGPAKGCTSLIPAFHSDMILQAIGENTGFASIVIIALLMFTLLRKTIIAGYKSKRTFAFYFCIALSIATLIQFTIIALGSTGIIPLTGINVPFISSGMVSMILNMTGFGVVASIQQHNNNIKNISEIQDKNIRKYNYVVSILTWGFLFAIVTILLSYGYYQIVARNGTMLRPIYTLSHDKSPLLIYNPRISLLTDKLHAGNIYDRNGLLLATSDKTKMQHFVDSINKSTPACRLTYDDKKSHKRYYPFAEHTFFMLGDLNTKLYWSSPRGYMAEERHLTELRGFDNRLLNDNNEPVKVTLTSTNHVKSKFMPLRDTCVTEIQLRDYSPLLPYLKAGLYSRRIEKINNGKYDDKIKPQNVYLSIDARLQTQLQKELAVYVKKNYAKLNKLRISVVVTNARSGDLLASANYPLPNYKILQSHEDSTYNDNRNDAWKAYTDCDLGITFPSVPGSTAKIMSAMSGLKKVGTKATRQKYKIEEKELIFGKHEPYGWIDMETAIVQSSNCYFINLLNDLQLYDELKDIYFAIGAKVGKNQAAYYFDFPTAADRATWEKSTGQYITNEGEKAISKYNAYCSQKKSDRKAIRKMNSRYWQWAWGQGSLDVTPMALARAVSVVVNNGEMPVTRFVTKVGNTSIEGHDNIKILNPPEAKLLRKFMVKEFDKHRNKQHYPIISSISRGNGGGKTGTAERRYGRRRQNDGLYVCFVDTQKSSLAATNERTAIMPLAIAVRMERIDKKSSREAVKLTNDVVLKVLDDLKYLKQITK